ncbi:MAG: hypothetical protein Q9200_000219 [Gallowayella weberi]
MALTRLWATWGVIPDVVLGHSLGEYAALDAAGVLSSSDIIYLVGQRARLLEERCLAGSHAMLAIKSSVKSVLELTANLSGITIACVNGPQETVLGGSVAEINVAWERLTSQGVKSRKLNLQYAFHSSQVDVILGDFQKLANAVNFCTPKVPIISPLLSTVINDSIDESYLTRHARGTVNFSDCIATAQKLGVVSNQTYWLELGPHPVCSKFIEAELGAVTVTLSSLHKGVSPYQTTSSTLARLHPTGIQVQWGEYHRDFLDCLQLLHLPSYAFDNKNYWIQYAGDWNLTKGQTSRTAVAEAPACSLSTTSIHRVLSEVVDEDKATIVTESDVCRADLLAAISGHTVNGTALCPSSLYADMAYTVAEYLYTLLKPDGPQVKMNVCDMEVLKPFIAEPTASKGQMIRLSATARRSTGKADLIFCSGSGKSMIEHAKCHVEYELGTAWLSEWQRHAYLIKGRIASLKKSACAGTAHRILRGMAYKLFAAFVEYGTKYRGMEEVILDSPELEGTSHVVFQTSKSDGKFFTSPYMIDSVAHLAGFILNANETLGSSGEVYISHGWESMRFAEPLDVSKTYQSYVKMQPVGANMLSGDVYVLDGDRIIGMVGALKFRCIPRQLLNTFLPSRFLCAPIRPGVVNQRLALNSAAPMASPPEAMNPRDKSGVSPPRPTQLITDKALDIIASELGVPANELADSIEFAKVGVDSLMSLSIVSRMRIDLEIEVQSSLFTDYPTVRGMKGFLSQYDLSEMVEGLLEEKTSNLISGVDPDGLSSLDGHMTTPISLDSADQRTSSNIATDSESLSMIVRETISKEMGVDISELLATDDLASLGMDSLMSLSILSELRTSTGLSLPAMFLNEQHSIQTIEQALHITPPNKESGPKEHVCTGKARTTVKAKAPKRFASSVLLQGNPKIASRTLWLVPDGSGTTTSYVFLPEISREMIVWGLNSPYMKTPSEYHGGIPGLASKFVADIIRRQPQGPYNIGGWSAGGIIAYEIVRQMTDVDNRVDILAMLDAPSPAVIQPLPQSLFQFFASVGLLGNGADAIDKLPPWLLPHFSKTVEALSSYKPKKPRLKQCPKVLLIWAEDGVCKLPSDPCPDPYPQGHARWLLENRSDFGPNRWDEYVDGDRLTTKHMAGNHFSMMKEPCVAELGKILREVFS